MRTKAMEELIEGKLSKFWDEQPSNKSLIIVNSSLLTNNRKKNELEEQLAQMNERMAD